MQHKGLNQLLCAATVNHRFCETLLSNPAQALAAGYLEHTFSLTAEEREFVLGIQAQQLEDFAEQVYCWITAGANNEAYPANGHNGNGHNGNGHNGNGHNGYNGNGEHGYRNGHHYDALSQDCMVTLYTAQALVHA
jgi:hypothetical protein